ncbi:MAG: hypothetical protein ACKVIQ_21310 [Acidimicrobiales bacterium]
MHIGNREPAKEGLHTKSLTGVDVGFLLRGTPNSYGHVNGRKGLTSGTLDDVVMAICTRPIHTLLIEHDALREAPLGAMVAASIRTGEDADP